MQPLFLSTVNEKKLKQLHNKLYFGKQLLIILTQLMTRAQQKRII